MAAAERYGPTAVRLALFGRPAYYCADGLIGSIPDDFMQFSTCLAEWMVLHGWRSMLRSAPAGRKASGPGSAFDSPELLLPPGE
jgi:hypothetical protein